MNFELQKMELSISRVYRVGFRTAIHAFAKLEKSIFFEKNEHELSNMVMDHINHNDSNFSDAEITELDKIVKTAHMTTLELILKTI